MKLPFVSRKSYEIVENNYKKAMESRRRLDEENVKLQKELVSYKETYNKYNDMITECEKDKEELKKELKRIKAICTRNGISYAKKENK